MHLFSPLAQGMLTTKYLGGIPEGSRAARKGSLRPEVLSQEVLASLATLNDMAAGRGQTLAQMALAWVLRDPRLTSALVGASRPEQVIDSVGALRNLSFTTDELARIDQLATDLGDI